MAPLFLDFARKRPPFAGLAWLGLALLCLGLALAVDRVWQFMSVNAELAVAESRLTRVNKRPAHQARALAPDPLALAAAPALRQINLPWDQLLLELEGAANDSVALLAMEPDPAKRQVRLVGEGRTIADVLAYVERLGGCVSLRQPQLQIEEARLSEGQKVLGFTIIAEWVLP